MKKKKEKKEKKNVLLRLDSHLIKTLLIDDISIKLFMNHELEILSNLDLDWSYNGRWFLLCLTKFNKCLLILSLL